MSIELFYSLSFILGLCVGSFINVVAYRLPKMLYFCWLTECYGYLNLQPKFHKVPKSPLNLCFPASHCPLCKKKISFLHNIPVISYIFLKGKCNYCLGKISLHYPLVEILTGICSAYTAYLYGFEIKTLLMIFLTWILILQAAIDIKEYIIPDEITLPILWLGLILNKFEIFTDLNSAILGAILGYLSFWGIYWIFKLFTGKDGMGYGDFKLLSMLGAWFGYQKLLLIILISSAVGSLVGGILIICKKFDKNSPLPFGPYLAVAGWITMLWGNTIHKWYFHYC